jgi:phosphoribosylaminoimidazolecarboxamide formyltransferase/IMP cyclohydrolase
LDLIPVRRALISVSDKTGLSEFAKKLNALGVEIYSTGGTLKYLIEQGIPARAVEDYTGFPEMLDGRVKTLHPKVHGGLLARRDLASHLEAVERHDIKLFDLVVINLYPFESVTAKPGTSFDEAIENIDIGGPAMVRSAAKNAAWVAIVVSPEQYTAVMAELEANKGATTRALREKLRLAAFGRTAAYDAAISAYLEEKNGVTAMRLSLVEKQKLRYGENPHQNASYLVEVGNGVAWRQLAGKELSFNNILDLDIAIRLAADFAEPVCAIFKHTNPCGVATGNDQSEILQYAMDCDPVSFFGGIVVFNRPLGKAAAEKLAPHFFELVIAPEFIEGAYEILAAKKNLRLITVDFAKLNLANSKDLRSVPGAGGYLLQDQDLTLWNDADIRVVSRAQCDAQTMHDLTFAARVVKFVKSNAVVFASAGRTLAIGAGQMSRIDSIRIAEQKAAAAKLSLKGSVMASEAFFPFRDSVDACAKIGVRAIVQPGGSLRDAESIAAADEHGIVLVFTRMRHFRH